MSPNVMKDSAEACLCALQGKPFQIKLMGRGPWVDYPFKTHPTDIEWFGIDEFRPKPTQEQLDQDAYNEFALTVSGTDIWKFAYSGFMAGIAYARKEKP